MNRNEESAWDEVRKAKNNGGNIGNGGNAKVSEVRKKPYDSFSPARSGSETNNAGTTQLKAFDFGNDTGAAVKVKKAEYINKQGGVDDLLDFGNPAQSQPKKLEDLLGFSN